MNECPEASRLLDTIQDRAWPPGKPARHRPPPNGTPAERSNLLFHNLSYPNSAVIGDVAPFVSRGRGQIILPRGFEYYARAKVDCDAGTQIETRESRPVQRIRIDETLVPRELTFIIPGPPCIFWIPRP